MRRGQTDIWRAIEGVRATRDRHAQNKARRAVSLFQYQSVGPGQCVETKLFAFQTGYLGQPNFTYGYAIHADDEHADDQTDFIFGVGKGIPQCFAMVYRWQIDDVGLYTGAWVALEVMNATYLDDANDVQGVVLDHSFHFTGIAIKNLPGWSTES